MIAFCSVFLFSPFSLRICTGDLAVQTHNSYGLLCFFFEHSNHEIIIVKYDGGVVSAVCQHMILKSNLYRNTCVNRLAFINEIKTFVGIEIGIEILLS